MAPVAAANGTAGKKTGARRGKRTRYDTSSSSEDEEDEEPSSDDETDEVCNLVSAGGVLMCTHDTQSCTLDSST